MQKRLTKRQRLITAVIAVIIFTASKLWSTPLEITWQLVLIALPMPILYGVGFYWMMGIDRKPFTSIFSRWVEKSRSKELSHDWAYEQATTELENVSTDKAVWARAFAECDGDEGRAKAAYIKRRVERLLAEQAAAANTDFEESEESKRSRSNMKRIYVGSALVGAIAIAGLFIGPRLFSTQVANSTKFDPSTAKIDRDGWETIVPASEAKKWAPPPDAIETSEAPSKKPFDPDDFLAKGAEADCAGARFHPRAEDSAVDAAVAASKRGEHETAYRMFLELAMKCNITAQYNIGVMYENGRGVERNYEAAVKWYRLAMSHGDAEATSNLGVMYAKGNGVKKDVAESIRLYRLAAAKGDAGAQYNLGWVYSQGDGVSKDLAEASKWLSLSSAQGFAKAQGLLGWMYSAGEGVTKDNLRAHMWLGLSAANENEGAKKNLAILKRSMTEQQISEAQQLQKSCAMRKYKNC